MFINISENRIIKENIFFRSEYEQFLQEETR